MNHFKQYNIFLWGSCFLFLPLLVAGQKVQPFSLPYHLNHPLRQLELDESLNEISGLSMSAQGEYLLAIQDEKGSLFYLDKETGEIIKALNFWKDGDYEGVELTGEDVFVVKSTGTLYQIKNAGQENQTVVKYNDFLSSNNNIEGLTYWPKENKLLLACKAQPGEQIDATKKKAIYAFDLDRNSFDSLPFMLIERSVINQYLKQCQPGPHYMKICDLFNVSKDEFKLSPSAIAIHPLTKQLYLLSSRGNLLLVVSLTGKILHMVRLPPKIHHQPEGICFDKSGNMYIANEKRKENKANIVVYGFE